MAFHGQPLTYFDNPVAKNCHLAASNRVPFFYPGLTYAMPIGNTAA